MLDWFEKRKAYRLGQEVATAITTEIDARIEASVIPGCEKGIDVLIGQLGTVWDNPPHDPKVFARAELDIFQHHMKGFLDEARAEINISTYKWDGVIEDTGIRSLLDHYISQRFEEIALECDRAAKQLLGDVLIEIDRRDGRLD